MRKLSRSVDPRSQLIWNMRCFVMKLKSHDHKFDSELVLAPAQCNISQHSDVCWNDLIRILSLNLIRCFSDLSFYKKLMLNKIFWYYTFMFQSLIIIMKRILNSKVDSRSNDSISMTMTKSQINSQNYKWSNQINIGQGQNMVWQGWTDTWRILSHHLVKIMKESSCFSYQYFCLSFGN